MRIDEKTRWRQQFSARAVSMFDAIDLIAFIAV